MRASISLGTALLLASALQAQTTIGGFVYDGQGGPLRSGVVYHVTGTLSVPAGQTLTVEVGAIVKSPSGQINVQGVLAMVDPGTPPGTRAIFTSIHDDTAGGDTNGNGAATTPAPGDWLNLFLSSTTSGSNLQKLEIRYAGRTNQPSLSMGSDVGCDQVLVRDGLSHGISLTNRAHPTMTDCRIENCAGRAVIDVPINAMPGFQRCIATGNGISDTMYAGGNLSTGTALTIGPDNLLGDGVLHVRGSNYINAGATLTLLPDTVVKFGLGNFLNVAGSLDAVGTAAAPIVFTSIHDDSHGGDTNKNGAATLPAAGDWFRLDFSGGSTCHLEYAHIRYSGGSSGAAIDMPIAAAVMRHCVIDYSGGVGLDFLQAGTPVIEDCAFQNNTGIPMTRARWHSLPNLRDNTATGNLAGDYLGVKDVVVGNVEVWPWNYPNEVLVMEGAINVPAGTSLQLNANVILKQPTASANSISGQLELLGGGHRPVIITCIGDDTVGGDTQKNGPSTRTGGPAPWYGLPVNSGSTLRLQHCVLRRAGFGGRSALYLRGAGHDLYGVRVEDCDGHAFDVGASGTISQCVAWDCAQTGFRIAASGTTLVHCTAVANRIGFELRSPQTGNVVNSIAWSNTANDFLGYGTTRVSSSCGRDAPLGNLQTDPLFEDEAGGDFRLQLGSPCVNTALAAPPPPVPVTDALENSRRGDGTLSGNDTPDMGAYERFDFTLRLDGDLRPTDTLTIGCDGPPGVWVLMIGENTLPFAFPGFGYVTILPVGFISAVLSVGPTGDLAIPLPPGPFPPGIAVNFQGLAVSASAPTRGGFTNRCRLVTHAN